MASTNFFINVKSKGAGKASKDIKNLTGNMDELAGSARTAMKVLGAGFLIKQIYDVGRSAIDTASQFEVLKVRLTQMYGSVQRGEQAFKAFNKVASTTPFALKNVVDAGASLKAFGIDAEEMIKPVADLAAFMQIDVVDAASQMGRAFAGGAGAADMLREKGILKLIQDSQGIADLGRLTKEDFADVFVKALTDPEVGIIGATDKLSNTWFGAVSNFEDNVDKIKDAIGTELITALKPMLDDVNTELGRLGDIGWDNVAKSFIDNLDFVLDLAASVAGVGGKIIGLSMADGIRLALADFRSPAGWMDVLGIGKGIADMPGMEDVFGDPTKVSENSEQIAELWNSLSSIISEGYGQIIANAEALKELEDPEGSEGEPDAIKVLKKKLTWEQKFFKSKLGWQKQLSDTDIANSAIQAKSASEGMKTVVKAEAMEAVAGLIASILKSVPYPFNLLAAAGAGGAVNAAMDRSLGAIPSFAQGGDFVTSGSQMIMVGDNPSGRERVQVTPLDAGGEATGGGGSVNITFNSPVMSADYTEDVIIPQLKEAVRRGADIGVS